VWFSYVTGAMMLIPVVSLAVVPFLNGDINNHALNQNFISASVSFYGGTPSTFQSIVMGIVWFWVIGWSSYGPEAPATFAPEFVDTKDDTRKALASAGILNCFLCLLLPLTIVAELGTGTIAKDTTYIAYLTSALDNTVGSTLGGLFVVFLSAGLLLSMNTATMDGSRALYGMAKEGLTVKQLDRLNHFHVPGRAMALDCILNICLLYFAPSLLFILVAGNIGYVLSHVFALSGVLLLRRDRPDWPRPFRLSSYWTPVIWLCLAVNLIATVFGVLWIKYTGYLIKGTDVTGYRTEAIIVGLAALAAGVLGYVIGQYQHGRTFSFKDPSDEAPSPAVYELLGTPTAAVAGD
jgi:amino acid transporter